MLTLKVEGNSLHAGSLPPSTPVTFRVSIVPTQRQFTLGKEKTFLHFSVFCIENEIESEQQHQQNCIIPPLLLQGDPTSFVVVKFWILTVFVLYLLTFQNKQDVTKARTASARVSLLMRTLFDRLVSVMEEAETRRTRDIEKKTVEL